MDTNTSDVTHFNRGDSRGGYYDSNRDGSRDSSNGSSIGYYQGGGGSRDNYRGGGHGDSRDNYHDGGYVGGRDGDRGSSIGYYQGGGRDNYRDGGRDSGRDNYHDGGYVGGRDGDRDNYYVGGRGNYHGGGGGRGRGRGGNRGGSRGGSLGNYRDRSSSRPPSHNRDNENTHMAAAPDSFHLAAGSESVRNSAAGSEFSLYPATDFSSSRLVVNSAAGSEPTAQMRSVPNLWSDIIDNTDEINKLRKENDDLKEKIRDAMDAFGASLEEKDNEIAAFRMQYDELKQQCDKLKQQHEMLKQQHEMIKQQRNQIMQQRDEFKKQHDDLKQQCDNLKQQHDELKQKKIVQSANDEKIAEILEFDLNQDHCAMARDTQVKPETQTTRVGPNTKGEQGIDLQQAAGAKSSLEEITRSVIGLLSDSNSAAGASVQMSNKFDDFIDYFMLKEYSSFTNTKSFKPTDTEHKEFMDLMKKFGSLSTDVGTIRRINTLKSSNSTYRTLYDRYILYDKTHR